MYSVQFAHCTACSGSSNFVVLCQQVSVLAAKQMGSGRKGGWPGGIEGVFMVFFSNLAKTTTEPIYLIAALLVLTFGNVKIITLVTL